MANNSQLWLPVLWSQIDVSVYLWDGTPPESISHLGIESWQKLMCRSRSRPPCSSYSSTAAFARSELSRPQYKSQGRSSGPELRGLNWDRATSFADLIIPSALPSICIGELSMNGRLVFAFVDSRNELLCAPAEVDEWGSPCLRSYNVGSKASVCIKPPFTTLSDTAIREYISAYANWIMRYSSPPASSSNESTPEFGIITPHTEDGQSPTNRFGSSESISLISYRVLWLTLGFLVFKWCKIRHWRPAST